MLKIPEAPPGIPENLVGFSEIPENPPGAENVDIVKVSEASAGAARRILTGFQEFLRIPEALPGISENS